MGTRPSSPHQDDEFAARLRQRLGDRRTRSDLLSEARQGYREAACLLGSFDPTRLQRVGGGHRGGGVVNLVDDCVALGDTGRTVWTLKPDVREQTLRGLDGVLAARRALAANIGDYGDGPERIAWGYLTGKPPRLEQQDGVQLANTLQVVGWLTLVPGIPDLPVADEVAALRDLRRLLAPLRQLVGVTFQGRGREVEELRDYVGVLPPSSMASRVRKAGRGLSTFLRGGEQPPLLIHGPGGIGKSTLLAKFVLDHLTPAAPDFPFAYVDFERPTVSVREPLTLVAECARQLAVQHARHRDALNRIASSCGRIARAQREERDQLDELNELATTRGAYARDAAQRFHATAKQDESRMVRALADTVRDIVGPGREDKTPFLIVLDSFEEAQYRGSSLLDRMWAIFRALQERYPRVRIVVSGRAPVGHPAMGGGPRTIELKELDPASAVLLLRAHGVRDDAMAEAIARRLGGSPLTLTLAAQVAGRAVEDGLTEDWLRTVPARRRSFNRSVDQMLIQGVLYDRIITHVADQDVRRLAHPGLVLRRITPDIIREVLAPHCLDSVPDRDRAKALFEEMSRELSLVELTAPETLTHRPDVRRIMLRLLEGDRYATARAIEQDAVAFYARRPDPEDRAEEIYHRLRLGDGLREVAARWQLGIEPFLIGTQDELPPRSAAFLTARLGGDISLDLLDGADQEDWERITAREVEELIAQGLFAEAEQRLGRRANWTPCGPLHSLHAEVLARSGRSAEARRLLSVAIDQAEQARCAELRLEQLLLSARLATEDGDLAAAEDDLTTAETVATSLNRDLEALGALLERARLSNRLGAPVNPSDADAELAARLVRVSDETLASRPTLLRAVAAEVGDREPQVLDRALALVGLPEGDDSTVPRLTEAITDAVSHQPRLVDAVLSAARGLAVRWASPVAADVADCLEEARSKGTLNQFARRLLRMQDDSGALRSGLAAAMGAGTSALEAGPAATESDPPANSDARIGRVTGPAGDAGKAGPL